LKKSATNAKNGTTKKQVSKIQKHKSKIKGEKEGKKGKSKREKMDVSICIFFIYFAFSICFLFFPFILHLSRFFQVLRKIE